MSTIKVNNIAAATGTTNFVSGNLLVTGSMQVTGNVHLSGNLTVMGTTTTVNSTTFNVTSSITFEGPASAHETTLGVTDPTADATINLPAMSAGTYHVPVLTAASTTAVSSTPGELNLLDGSAKSTSSITVVDSDAFIIIDGTTTKQIPASDIKTYAGSSTAADDITVGDAAVSIRTTSGDITIDSDVGSINVTGSTLTLSGSDNVIIRAKNSSAQNAIVLSASAGGIDMNAAGPIHMSGSTFTVSSSATTDGSDGAGSILLSASHGGIGLAWSDGKDLWAEGGRFVVVANENASEAIKLHADAGANQTIQIINDAGTADGAEGSGAIDIEATVGGISLHAADDKDIAIEAGQVVLTANENAVDAIKLHADAGTSQTINIVNDAGTAPNAIILSASAGGIDVNAAGTIHMSASAFTVSSSATTDGTDGAGSILLSASHGGIGLAWSDGKDLWAEGGRFVVVANEDAADAIKLHADAGTSQTIQIVNDAGTTDGSDDAGAIELSATAGGIGLAWNDGKDLWAEGGRFVVTANEDAVDAIKLHADAGTSQTINIVNDAGTSESAIAITSTAGGVDIDAAAGKDVTIDGGQLLLTSAHDTANAIYLRANAGTSETIKIHADQGSGAGSIELTSDAGGIDVNAAGAISLDSSGGSIDINVVDGQTVNIGLNGAVEQIIAPHGTAGSELYSVINTAGTTDGTDAAGAILLSAVAGGIGLAWADDKDLWAEGGRFVVTANEDAVDAIKLHADAGTSQTINIVNDAGTAKNAIVLSASAGGIDINAAGLIHMSGSTFTVSSSATTDGTDGAGSILLSASHGGIGLAWSDGKDLWAEGGRFVVTANENAADAIKLHADAGASQTIQIVNDAGTTDGSDDAGAIELSATAGGIGLAWADDKDLWAEGGQFVVTANHDVAQAIKLHADAGTSQTIQIINDAGTADGAEGSGAIDIEATAGGISLHAADDKDIAIEGGQIVLTANHNTAESIKLHADAGANQTIQIINDAGTADGAEGSGAIDIEATLGGISLHAADDKDIAIEAGQVVLTANHNTAGAIKLHADAGASQSIEIINDAGSGHNAIVMSASAGGIDINAAGPIHMTGSSHTISGSGAITLDSSYGNVDINALKVQVGSSTANRPRFQLKNTTADANSSQIRFVKDRGAAGQDNDNIGIVEFYSKNDAGSPEDILFSRVRARIHDATDGEESGILALQVAAHDGGVEDGIVLTGGSVDAEVDVTIAAGAASMTTVAGDLTVTGADIIIGGDSDGTDRNIVFGHSTLKTIMGIDDSADTFILNTDDAFDATIANNSLSIDANHKMIVGGSIRAKGYVHMTHHNYAIGTAGERLIPWYNFSDLNATSPDSTVQTVAPFDGRLVRVLFRPENHQDGGASTLRLYKAANGTAAINSLVERVDATFSGTNAHQANTFNCTGSAHYSAGEVIGISIDPENTPGQTMVTCVWEYNTSGL
jgi:hypothetical protein